MEQEDPTYVSLENPISFRKEILEDAIHATEMLKDYEHFKLTRDRKTKKLQELRGIVFDMRKTYKDLKSSLPELPEEKTEEQKEVEKKELPKEIEEKPVKVEPPKVAVSREEDALTKELMDIQRKLRAL